MSDSVYITGLWVGSTDPTSNRNNIINDGQLWLDTTNDMLKWRKNGTWTYVAAKNIDILK